LALHFEDTDFSECHLVLKLQVKFFKNIFRISFDIPGVEIYIDDILIQAKSKKEHDEILEKVFVIAQKNNVKFNLNKCKFGLK
jgi:hypothetical protein